MTGAMVLMGTVGYFVLEAGLNAHDVVFFRCLLGAGFLALYCWLRGLLRNTGLTRASFGIAVLSGVFLVCNWIMLFASFETASISTATVVYHTQPLFFVLMGVFFLGDRLSIDRLCWIAMAFVGVMMVVGADIEDVSLSSNFLLGMLLALGAALFYAVTSVLVKRLGGLKPHLVALIQVSVGALMLAPLAELTLVGTMSGPQWGNLVVLGAVHTCLTYILMYSAYQKLPTPLVAVLSFIYPLVAILVDYLAYGKALEPMQIAGGALILFGGYAVNQNLAFLRRKPVSGKAAAPDG